MIELPQKALTLHQPYAWLLAHGYKPVENRPKTFTQKNFRGPFWIHAGQLLSDDVWTQARGYCDQWLGKDFVLPPLRELVFGYIIGLGKITGAHLPVGGLFAPKTPVPWHFPDQYGLIVEEAKTTKRPLEARGYNGFWPVLSADLEKLRELV